MLPSSRVIRVGASIIEELPSGHTHVNGSCDVHDEPHPATHRYHCGRCDYDFRFCNKDGKAALRILRHICRPRVLQ